MNLDPKDAFFGGRTCAHKIFEKATDDREITYLDVTSLYPAVNYFTPYPVGVPDVIIPKESKVNWKSPEDIIHTGLYKVRIIAPKDLYLPVLPIRTSSKDPRLMFPLCIQCAANNTRKCVHTDEQRAWTSTITSIELKEALLQGYRVTRCYRIWSYLKTDHLFKEYVQVFMKIKVEASGFPEGINTDEEKKGWKDEYLERLGIDIDLNNVKENPGLRYMAKYL